jgi:hypothetical protein
LRPAASRAKTSIDENTPLKPRISSRIWPEAQALRGCCRKNTRALRIKRGKRAVVNEWRALPRRSGTEK